MGFDRIEADEVWSGELLEVWKEVFRHDDGEIAIREVVRHPGAVLVLAIDGDELVLVTQPREAVDEEALLEVPAGKLDEGEEPIATAKRELAEEVGLAGASWRHLKTFYSSPGFTDEQLHLYQASELSEQTADSGEEERITIERIPLSDLDRAIERCRDAKSLVALLWLRAYGPGAPSAA